MRPFRILDVTGEAAAAHPGCVCSLLHDHSLLHSLHWSQYMGSTLGLVKWLSGHRCILPFAQMKPPRQDELSAEEAANRVQGVDEHMERLHDVALEISHLLSFVSLNMQVRWRLLLAVVCFLLHCP